MERDSLSLNVAAERWRQRVTCKCHREPAGHISELGLSSSSGISCPHRLRISHWGREGRVSEGCDEGQWLRLPYLGWRQKQRHESPVKPVRKGQLSIQKINLRLADFQEEIRQRDAGSSVSRREVVQSMWDEREDEPEGFKINEDRVYFGEGREMRRMHSPFQSPSVKLLKDLEYKSKFAVSVISSSPVKLLKSLTWWCRGTCLSMYFYKHSRERSNLGRRFSGALTSRRGTTRTATTSSNKWGMQIANVLHAKLTHAGGKCRYQMQARISHSPAHSECCVPQKQEGQWGHQPHWRGMQRESLEVTKSLLTRLLVPWILHWTDLLWGYSSDFLPLRGGIKYEVETKPSSGSHLKTK